VFAALQKTRAFCGETARHPCLISQGKRHFDGVKRAYLGNAATGTAAYLSADRDGP